MSKVIHQKIINYVTYSLLGAIAASAAILNSATAGAAQQATARASVTVESTCSMTATINTAHNATMVNGTYSGGTYPDGIGKTTIQTFCNDQNGYSIYAVGFTNNELGNTVLKGANLSSTYDIVTGTATSGTAGSDVSNWAMKVSSVAGTYAPTIMNGFNDFSVVPSAYTKVATFTSSTDTAQGTNIGSSIETTYAAYISNGQPSGTYTGQVKYVLVHPSAATPTTYTMQNIAEWKSQLLPGEQVTATDNRDGKIYTVAKLDDGNVWMTQNLGLCIGCPGTNALTSANTDLNTDLGIAEGYSTSGGVTTWTPLGNSTVMGQPAEITNFASGNPANSVTGWTNSNTAPYIADGKDTILVGTNSYVTTTEAGVTTSALTKCTAAGNSEDDCRHGQVGNYYNYTAAIAMNDSSSISANYSVAPNSICPAGWRLPNGLTQTGSTVNISDFNTLLNAYGIAGGNDTTGDQNVGYATGGFAKMEVSPLNFARSGYVYDTTLYNYATNGRYWSSTTYSGTLSYYLYYSSGILYPAGRVSRNGGWSVRCVARKTIDDIENMQDFIALSDTDKNDVVKSMVTNTQYSLKDTRDNKTYTVAKLEDGNVWMTKNLDLCIGCTGTAALNSTNTDLNSDLGSTAGYSTSGSTITWTPAGNATVTGTPAQITNFASGNPANSVTGWTNSQTAPYMATGSLHEQTGNYYNYTAAIAMNDSSSISANYTVAPNSICPAGWRLPNGLTQTGSTVNISDFNTLLNAYGIAGGNDTTGDQNVGYAAGGFAKMETTPLNFARSGGVSDTTLYNYTTYGRYWSSTTYSGTYSYVLYYYSGALYPAVRSNRYNGWSVRCMLR